MPLATLTKRKRHSLPQERTLDERKTMIELHRYFSAISSTRSREDATSGINQIGISERENSHEVEWLGTVEIRIEGLRLSCVKNYNKNCCNTS